MDSAEPKLPAKVAEKYESSDVAVFSHKGVTYDLRTISMADAKMLADDETFPFLKAKNADSADKK